MMSLNTLIITREGSDFTGAQFSEWVREAGFAETEVMRLAGPAGVAIDYKR